MADQGCRHTRQWCDARGAFQAFTGLGRQGEIMIGKSSRVVASIAAIAALGWASAALALYQESSVTVTDQGKPVPEQTVTLTEKEKVPQKDPQQPKPKPRIKRIVKLKTTKNGKIAGPV